MQLRKFVLTLAASCLCSVAFAQTGHNVVWSDLVGSSVTGTTLTKTAADGWGNSAATGIHFLGSSTDGWLEYTVDAINRKAFGLSDLNSNNYNGAIDYCFNIGADSKAYIFNNSTQLAFADVVVGDILRIERTGSTVYFKKNGTTIHTLTSALTTALLVDVSLYSNGASLVSMKTSFGPSAHPVLQWTSVKGMSVSGDNLMRTIPYTAGYSDSGGASTDALAANQSGWVEAVMSELDKRRVFGLSSNSSYTNATGIQFALQFDNDNIHLYENGSQGSYLGKFTANSIVKISREGTQVKYYVNGVLKHTSSTASSGALYVHAGFYNQLGTIRSIYASFGSGQGLVPDRTEYEALKTFYDSLTGTGWTNKTNWPTGTWPRHAYNTEYGTWFGITVQSGDVGKINFSSNNLSGTIASTIDKLSRLNYLRVHNNTGVSGHIPTTITSLSQLTLVQLTRCQLTGSIPTQIGNLTGLTWFGVYGNSLSGSLPSSLFDLVNLTDLYLYENNFTGNLSTQISSLTHLRELWIHRNGFSGSLPANLPATLLDFYLFDNEFTGDLPSSWNNLANLKIFHAHRNQLSGELPSWIGSLTKLTSLAVADNGLDGTIPSSYGSLVDLTGLYLYKLQLSGPIPSTLQNLNKLTVIDLKYSNLEGDIPSWLMNKPTLKTFHLNNNNFTSLPDFSARTDKASLVIHVENNKIPVADIERYFTAANVHPFDSLFYGGQQVVPDDSVVYAPQLSELQIEAPSGGAHGVYVWEKLVGGVWTNVNSQNQSGMANAFSRTTMTTGDAGTYRYTITNSWMSNIHIESGPITVTMTDAISEAPSERLYNGLITASRWRTDKPYSVDGNEFEGMYVYTYDDKYQIKEARWAEDVNYTLNTFSFASNKYRLMGMSYDPNGNILSLKRYNEHGARVDDFTYAYENTSNPTAQQNNKLTSVSGYTNAYTYNAIGQMIGEDKVEAGADQFVDYNVSGKVIAVFSDQDKTQKKAQYLYDDRGFRLAKVSYSPENEVRTTWYIRDASGSVMSIYEQEGEPEENNENPLTEIEIPVYGSGKIGTFYPEQDGSMNYEITDHLGNVRALLRENTNVYTATMEDNGEEDITNPRVQEMQYFQNLFETEQVDFIRNHTKPSLAVPHPMREALLYWNDTPGTTAAEKSIGPAIALQVNPGDIIEAEAYAYYYHSSSFNRSSFSLSLLSSVLGNTFSGGTGFEGSQLSETVQTFSDALTAGGFFATDNNNTIPYAYLNYIVFDEDMLMVASDAKRVTDAASNGNFPSQYERVTFNDPIEIPMDGKYIYVWVSCESRQTQIWFDDITVKHTSPAMVVQATDYGMWGDVLREQKAILDTAYLYRWGMQGQFSERDEETGWNSFELRMNDPVIGRWTTPDPIRQHWSRYLSMGNDPVNRTDPNGGLDEYDVLPDGTKVWRSDKGGFDVDYFNYYATDAVSGGMYYTGTTAESKSFLGWLQLGLSTSQDMYLGFTIEVDRFLYTDESTIGQFTLNGDTRYFLEPAWDADLAQTRGSDRAISPGTYNLIPHVSCNYEYGKAIRLIDVPGRTAVLIHTGNYPADTEGCFLPGCGFGTNQIQSGTSKITFNEIWKTMDNNRYGARIIINNTGGR